MKKILFVVSLIFITNIVLSKDLDKHKVDSLTQELENTNNKANTYYFLATEYNDINDSLFTLFLETAHINAIAEKNHKISALSYYHLGDYYCQTGEFDKALKVSNKALRASILCKVDTIKTKILNNIGMSYEGKSNFDKALEYYNKSYEINKKIKFNPGIANNLNNIGMIYYNWREYDNAIKYYNQALIIDSVLKRKHNIAIGYNNIGLCYFYNNNYEQGLSNFNKAIEIDKEINENEAIGNYYNNIGLVYYAKEENHLAITNFNKAIDFSIKNNQNKNATLYIINLSAIYNLNIKDYKKGFPILEKGIAMAKKYNYPNLLSGGYGTYYRAYKEQKNFELALKYYKLYKNIRDSIFNKESSVALEQSRAKFETEKKESEILVLKKDQLLDKEKIKSRNIVISAISLGMLLIILLLFFIYKAYKQKHKAYNLIRKQKEEITEKNEELNQQNEEILAQRDEIIEQKDVLEKQNEQITDSIKYAQQIQKAILPPEEYITKEYPEHFIINLPRDIVSGDFYWMKQINNKFIIAAADCTGHGIPGAFMSMLGITLLNEIIINDNILDAGEILDNLKARLIKSLHQTGKENEQKDGMDISLCVIDEKEKSLNYAGAYNPLLLIRNNNIEEIKANKMPIGIFMGKDVKFKSNNIKLESNDKLYIFSDGYKDQFGGKKGKKMGKKIFRQSLLDCNNNPIIDQKLILHKQFIKWIKTVVL